MKPNVVIVLAHLMDVDGTLGVESRARADKGAEISRTHGGCPIILMGWNYRDDTDLCISDAIASYLRSSQLIADARLFIDRESRDTVGDAILSKRKFPHLVREKNVWVVTSDYHVERTHQIFEFVYGLTANLRVIGVQTEWQPNRSCHEHKSLMAFRDTFAGVDSGDDKSIFETLVKRHPFYNGEIYPILSVDDVVSHP